MFSLLIAFAAKMAIDIAITETVLGVTTAISIYGATRKAASKK